MGLRDGVRRKKQGQAMNPGSALRIETQARPRGLPAVPIATGPAIAVLAGWASLGVFAAFVLAT
jgi:hypothetical protein